MFALCMCSLLLILQIIAFCSRVPTDNLPLRSSWYRDASFISRSVHDATQFVAGERNRHLQRGLIAKALDIVSVRTHLSVTQDIFISWTAHDL